MLKHFLTHNIVIRNEPQLEDYLRSDESDYNSIIEEAVEELITDLTNMNYDLTKICKELTLLSSEEGTGICENGALFTGNWSDIDYARRLRFFLSIDKMGIVSPTSLFSITISIDGTNVETGFPSDDQIKNVFYKVYNTEPINGDYSYVLTSMFNRYRISVIAIANNNEPIDLQASLIENIYTELLKFKVRAKIYLSMKKNDFDEWHSKFVYYDTQYKELLRNSNFYVDNDQSEQIEENESESPTDNIIVSV